MPEAETHVPHNGMKNKAAGFRNVSGCLPPCPIAMCFLLHTVNVRAVAGVDFNHFALIDKKRYTHLGTCFEFGGLRCVSSGIAF